MDYLENKKFGDLLTKHVLSKLTGQHDDFKRKTFNKLPSRDIPIGVLFGVEPNKDKEKEVFETFYKSNSISVKFLLKDTDKPISIIPSLSVYTKSIPTFEEQTEENKDKTLYDNFYNMAKIWERHDIKFDEITTNIKDNTQNLDFEKHIEEIKIPLISLKKVLE